MDNTYWIIERHDPLERLAEADRILEARKMYQEFEAESDRRMYFRLAGTVVFYLAGTVYGWVLLYLLFGGTR